MQNWNWEERMHCITETDIDFTLTFRSLIISASSFWTASLNLLTEFVDFCRWSRLYSSWMFSRVLWFSNSSLVKVQDLKPVLTKQASNCDWTLFRYHYCIFYVNTKICIHWFYYTTSCGYTGNHKDTVILAKKIQYSHINMESDTWTSTISSFYHFPSKIQICGAVTREKH